MRYRLSASARQRVDAIVQRNLRVLYSKPQHVTKRTIKPSGECRMRYFGSLTRKAGAE